MAPLEPGAYVLRLRAAGYPGYSPPTRLQGRLLGLEATGAVLRDVPEDDGTWARRKLFLGEVEDDVVARANAEDRPWLHLARGDLDAAEASLRAVSPERLGWLMRTHPREVVPMAETLLGDGFAERFQSVMDPDVRGRHPTQALRDALLVPRLEAIPADDPSGRRVRLWRAAIHLDRGARARARTLATSVIEAREASEVELGEAWLLLARLAESADDRRRCVDQALAVSPDPTLARRVSREGWAEDPAR
jgi:hypothetical protein